MGEISLDNIVRNTIKSFVENFNSSDSDRERATTDKYCKDFIYCWCADKDKVKEYQSLYERLKREWKKTQEQKFLTFQLSKEIELLLQTIIFVENVTKKSKIGYIKYFIYVRSPNESKVFWYDNEK